MKNLAAKLAVMSWSAKSAVKENAKKAKNLFVSESGEAGLIVAIILIVVCIALAIIFRDQLMSWINSLFTVADDEINNIANNPSGALTAATS